MDSGRGSRKGRIGVGLVLFWVLSVQVAEAGSIGRPAASGRPGSLSELNLEYDLVQRDLSTNDVRFQGTATSERVLLEGIYGVGPFSDIYLRAGMADLETSSRGFNGDLGPAVGGGGRLTIYQRGDLKIGFGLQFLELFSHGGGGPSTRANWTEIETFLGGEVQGIERFIPYFGVSFSQVLGRFEGGPAIRADNFIGLFVGAEFHVYDRYYVSTEARIISENSLTLRLHYRL
ncbi:MAG TPA: hypothetical protein VFA47_07340 [Candidatus Manganitrophaceae bacterium]|nr:hypothetical protein [Candidatus Manganitrophaceae bacterium]